MCKRIDAACQLVTKHTSLGPLLANNQSPTVSTIVAMLISIIYDWAAQGCHQRGEEFVSANRAPC